MSTPGRRTPIRRSRTGTFADRPGNRSALESVIDQHRVKSINGPGGPRVSDPNRPDDPESIVRLVGQVVRVSAETVAIVERLPDDTP